MKFHERRVISCGTTYTLDFSSMCLIWNRTRNEMKVKITREIKVTHGSLQYCLLGETNWCTLSSTFQDAYQDYLVDKIMLGKHDE